MTSHQPGSSLRRARRSFWVLLVVSVVAAGSLTNALAAAPSPATGLRGGTSALILLTTILLAARVHLAVDRAVGNTRTKATSRRARGGRHRPKGSSR